MTAMERAAMILWANSLLKPYCAGDVTPAMQIPESQPDWQRFTPLVRDVLRALRDPDADLMRRATGDGGELAEHNARVLWQHMIDALLSEQK